MPRAHRAMFAAVALYALLAACGSSAAAEADSTQPSSSAHRAATSTALRHCTEALESGARIVDPDTSAKHRKLAVTTYLGDRRKCMAGGEDVPSICDAALGSVDAYRDALHAGGARRELRLSRGGYRQFSPMCVNAITKVLA